MVKLTKRLLQKIAEDRIADAQVLYANRRYSAAYYMAGYSIECSLKVLIAKQTQRHDFPDKKSATDAYTHEITKLVSLAQLQIELQEQIKSDSAFAVNWSIVKDWSEQSRYQTASKLAAKDMIEAISDESSGVLAWIKSKW